MPTLHEPPRWQQVDRDLLRRSYYAATAPRPRRWAALQGATQADVAIVGGGLAGLSAAIELRQRGLDVVLLEAEQVGYGASGRNGGQAIHGLACEMQTIESQLGAADARRVWDASIEALDLIRERIATHAIDCDWRDGWLWVATSDSKARKLRSAADRVAEQYGYPLTWVPQADLPRYIASPRYAAASHDARSGHLHPLKYTIGLAMAADKLGVRLYEGSAVQSLVQQAGSVTLRTAQGTVSARQVLLASNVYVNAHGGLAPGIGARVMPVGTYVVCSNQLGPDVAAGLIPCGAAVCDNNLIVDYFRVTPDHRLLFGAGVSYSAATPPGLEATMRRLMQDTFPQIDKPEVEYLWGGYLDVSMNRAPDFGRIGSSVYYLQGFSGHGLALTGLAGRLVAEAMTGDASRFDVFARLKHRPFPGGPLLRMPALVLAMAWYRLQDMLG